VTPAPMPRFPQVVLLVDDIRDHAVHYEAALTRDGFVVRVATTGQDALRLAREALPDCAIIDLRLPDMSGWDLCREIREPQPSERPAIIVLTPEVSKMCAENSAKAGCNAWIAHPMHADDLVRTVRQVLNAETDAPASLDEALLGSKRCPGCESDSVRATLRVGAIQYYCCKACGFCWRAEMVKA
jgi:DNA-binding response OmpR family regulator